MENILRHGCIDLNISWPGDADLGSSFDGFHSSVTEQASEEETQDKK